MDVVSKWCYNEWPVENADCGLNSEEEYAQDIVDSYINIDKAWPVVLVALLPSGEPCGTVTLDYGDMSDRPEMSPWLSSLFVPPQFRGHGIGSQLVRFMQETVRDLSDVDMLYLWVDLGKKQIGMYQKCGFEEIEQLEYCGNMVAIMKWTATEASYGNSPNASEL